MNTKAIDKAILEIIEKRSELNKIDYNDERYDDVEDELHELEDDFIDEHGEVMEEILGDVHDELCPDSDVLSPISYIADSYIKTGENENGPELDVTYNQGVYVEIDDYLHKETKLVIIPNPLRILLNIDRNTREIIWNNNPVA
ncbi:hypothetical protein [Sediminitomix flava]|uniref:Uncharacterized protein n=1 Tax=Sediminitomix flava TaxID=379075 RepID=A0A315ZB03_SEDFL|nr:hypothetical protein [Sediminitomix flava]PWJ41998.1 hypothetical protein BC781_103248 [Sediminitomix flava]